MLSESKGIYSLLSPTAPTLHLRVRDVRGAALLQIIKAMYLSGHFQVILVHGVMPAFDVDAALEPRLPQNGNDVCPIAVAETGRAVMNIFAPPIPQVLMTSHCTVASLPCR